MAAIGSIRKHSTFLVIIIGAALAAFVLGDFVKGGGNSRNINVGEVEGQEITIMDFNAEAEQNIDAKMQQQKTDRLSTDEIYSMKDQTWNDIVHRIIMDNEYSEIGLSVTSDELFDLIQGPNPHALIKQYFTNPDTKKYDRELVIRYLQNLDKMPEDAKQQWFRFEKYIKDDRLRTKFNMLLSKGYYLPKALAQVAYNEKSDKAEIDYIAAKFVDVKDSLFTPTDADYRSYYAEHKEEYKQKASRSIDYVVFKIVPSAQDLARANKEMEQIGVELAETVDVPRFINVNSDKPYDSSWFAKGQLPVQIDSIMFNSKVGAVSKPYILDGSLHVARLMEIGHRPDSMKASHILIAYAGSYNARDGVTRIKPAAKDLADSLLKVLKKNPSKMEALAKEFSNDPSVAQNSGDLGWFQDGQMVPAFNEAVYNNKVGSFVVTETPFGYHVIKVTGKKELVKKVKVAMVDTEIFASDNTYQNIYAKASKIATECNNLDQFNEYVSKNRLNKREMPNIREMSNYISGLKSPRQIVRWAFKEDVNVGDVSSVFDLEDMFVVAVLTDKQDAGFPTMEQAKDRMKLNVFKQLKGKYFADKMNSYGDDMDKIKANMNVMDKSVNPLFFVSRNLPGFTIENDVIGTSFGMKTTTTSKPIIGNAGVFIVKLNSLTKAGDMPSYKTIALEMNKNFEKRVSQDYPYTALKESVDVVDNRLDFY